MRSIDYERALKKEFEKLDKTLIPERNKELIQRYTNHRLARSISIARVRRRIQSLRLLCEVFDADPALIMYRLNLACRLEVGEFARDAWELEWG